jgi:uncharacterized protein (TIGR02246 family)
MKIAMLAATAVVLFGCAQPMPAPPAPNLKAQIDANNAAWAAAANRGDAAAVAAMYTENATMLPPGVDIQQGRAAIEKTIAKIGGSGIRNFALIAIDVSQVSPDTAREIGRFSLESPAPKKKWMKVDGKYVVVWKQVAGKWLLDVDIWNTNK